MKRRIALSATRCIKCGKEIYTANQSITGNADLKQAFGVRCANCTTEAERLELDRKLIGRIAEQVAK